MKEPREWTFKDWCNRTLTMHVWRNNINIRIIQESANDEPHVLASAYQAERLGKAILKMAAYIREREAK